MGVFDGLFPSSTRTDVNTSVSRLINDKQLPDSIKSGVLKAVLKDSSVAENVIDEVSGSLALRAERMYRFAESKYSFGLPGGELFAQGQQADAVTETLVRLHGLGWSLITHTLGLLTSCMQDGMLSLQSMATRLQTTP